MPAPSSAPERRPSRSRGRRSIPTSPITWGIVLAYAWLTVSLAAGYLAKAPAAECAAPKAIVRKKKPTFARPAPEDLRAEILKTSDAVIEALAD